MAKTIPAIMGGQVSVAFSPSAAVAPQIDAGSVRVLGVTSSERVAMLDAPTLREHGIDVELENWKILVAPPGISSEERRRLEGTTAAMARSQTWRDALERYRWTDRLLMGPALHDFLDQEDARWRSMVRARHPLRDGVVAVALSVGAYVLFARLLDLALPAGVLDGLI